MRILGAITIITALSLWSTRGICQKPVFEFSEQFEFAAADPLGHFYLVKEDQIIKVDTLGNLLYTFSYPELGIISSIDPSDPFRILVYYRAFNQVLFLDRTLSPIGESIKLDDLDVFSISGICRARQGGFWIIDENNSSLLHLDNNLIVQTNIHLTNLNLLSRNLWLPMLEFNERLYICFPQQNIRQFDLYGKQLKTIPVKVNEISSLDNRLLLSSDNGVYIYQDSPSVLSGLQKLPIPMWEKLIISKEYALIQGRSGWSIFRLKKTVEGT